MTKNQYALSISEFCEAHRISSSFFYKLLRSGRGPRIMKIGKRTLVPLDASIEWAKSLEK